MEINREIIEVIAFDADDTLWVNEPYYQKAEDEFCKLLEDYLPQHSVSQELFKTEMMNLSIYGYGVKGFILSMIETATRVSSNKLSISAVNRIIEIGQELLAMPIELLDGIEDVLSKLSHKYKIIVATKGDLIDQERKLKNSNLQKYFHHVEIMSNKKLEDYTNLLKKIECAPENFLMIGNSINSDILPVIEVGGQAVHVPYHVTWAHEESTKQESADGFLQINKLEDLLPILL